MAVTMTNFKQSGLNDLLRQMEIGVVNIYYGIRALNLKFSYPHFRLIFVLESDGKSYFADDTQKAYCNPGDWFLIPPFCEITHNLNDTMHHLSIHFTATLGQSVSLVQPHNSFLTMTDNSARNRIIHTINSEPELVQCLLFRELCYNKLSEYVTQEDSSMILQLLKTPGYAALLDFLNTTATAKTGIDDMAAQCNLSRNAFVKRFKRDFGLPPDQPRDCQTFQQRKKHQGNSRRTGLQQCVCLLPVLPHANRAFSAEFSEKDAGKLLTRPAARHGKAAIRKDQIPVIFRFDRLLPEGRFIFPADPAVPEQHIRCVRNVKCAGTQITDRHARMIGVQNVLPARDLQRNIGKSEITHIVVQIPLQDRSPAAIATNVLDRDAPDLLAGGLQRFICPVG